MFELLINDEWTEAKKGLIGYCHICKETLNEMVRMIPILPTGKENIKIIPPHWRHPKGYGADDKYGHACNMKDTIWHYKWFLLAKSHNCKSQKEISVLDHIVTYDILCPNGVVIMLLDHKLSRNKMCYQNTILKAAGYKPIWVIKLEGTNIDYDDRNKINKIPILLAIPDATKAYINEISQNYNVYVDIINNTDTKTSNQVVDYNNGIQQILKPEDIFNITFDERNDDTHFFYIEPKTTEINVQRCYISGKETDKVHPELYRNRYALYGYGKGLQYKVSVHEDETLKYVTVGGNISVTYQHVQRHPNYIQLKRLNLASNKKAREVFRIRPAQMQENIFDTLARLEIPLQYEEDVYEKVARLERELLVRQQHEIKLKRQKELEFAREIENLYIEDDRKNIKIRRELIDISNKYNLVGYNFAKSGAITKASEMFDFSLVYNNDNERAIRNIGRIMIKLGVI